MFQISFSGYRTTYGLSYNQHQGYSSHQNHHNYSTQHNVTKSHHQRLYQEAKTSEPRPTSFCYVEKRRLLMVGFSDGFIGSYQDGVRVSHKKYSTLKKLLRADMIHVSECSMPALRVLTVLRAGQVTMLLWCV